MAYDTIEARQTELETFLDKHLSSKPNKPLNGKSYTGDGAGVDAQVVTDRVNRSKKAEKIQALFNGDNAGLPSESEGDQSLCNYLVFFCGYIPDQDVYRIVDEIFRNSKRMRPKWDTVHRPADGATYGQMTIETAITGTTERYGSTDCDDPPQDLWDFEDAEIHIQKQKGRDLSSSQKVELTEDILNHHGFNSLQLNIIMDLLKKVTGITKGAMADLQKNSEDSKPEDDSRTHAELSVAFIAEKLPHEPNHVVGCEGRIWTYGPVSGVYMDSTMKMLAIQVGDYFTGSDYCKRAGDYKGISNLIYNRLEDTTFFSTAPRGLPGASAFHQITTDGEHIVREYSPGLRARFKLPVDPDANCPTPRFEKFLKDTFPDDQDQIDLMQEVIGALLCCIAAGLQTAFYFYGEGGNGKNVMLDIVGGLFDDRLKCAIRPDHIVKEYYRAQLAGKLLNIVGEIEKDAFVGSEFKDVVSCDAPVTARLPYHEPFVFIPQCAHLFAGNHLPATKDHSEGQRRRWRFFHFRHRVPEGSRIQYLGQKILKEESPGILFWALSGAQRLMRNGGVLTPTDAHKELLEKWKQSSDSVEAFLHDPETVVLAPSRRCYRQKAFDAYIFFCRESNYRGLSKQNFYHRVESIFPVSRKNSEERHFSGFSLVEKEFHF